jgi:hypothetical protein
MRRLLVLVLAAAALGCALTAAALAATRGLTLLPLPQWLMSAESRTLERGFGGARPIRTWYTSYPRTIAVTFVFDHVVICGACSAPSNASLPRGRVIRVSYDRRTHRQGNSIRFCERRGSYPPLSSCLRR